MSQTVTPKSSATPHPSATPTSPDTPHIPTAPAISAALTRFRIASYVVGVALLTLTLVAMPLKYLADSPGLVAIVSPIHGFMYMVYVVLTFDLGRRASWPMGRTILLMLSGTIPFVSFYAERRAAAWAKQTQAFQ